MGLTIETNMINLFHHKDSIAARLKKITAKDWQNRLQAKGYDVIVTKHMKNTQTTKIKASKKTPTNTESLIRLKDQGYRVIIRHLRKVKSLDINEDGLFVYKVSPTLHSDSFVRDVIKEAYPEAGEIPYFKYVENGGATILELRNGEEKITVQATCYAKDNFCKRLLCFLSAEYFENDRQRELTNNWDFSPAGRQLAAQNMLKAVQLSSASIKVVDMICPTKELRAIIAPDIIVYIDSNLPTAYEDTASIYVRPTKDECRALFTAKYNRHQETVDQLIAYLRQNPQFGDI